MKRTSLILALALSTVFSLGCSSKNYVKQQTTPLVNKTNELDDLTAKNTRDLKDVDARAQAGIQDVNAKTAAVDEKALAAGKQADAAQTLASTAVTRVDSLQKQVLNLDNYKVVTEASVHFAFNRDNLTKEAKAALDQLAGEISKAKGYIITVEGGADGIGGTDYNYDLSQRRANSVIQYLAGQYSVPAHKIYVIGLGKDKPVESNKTSAGRAKNRRVDIRLMTNIEGQAAAAPASPSM